MSAEKQDERDEGRAAGVWLLQAEAALAGGRRGTSTDKLQPQRAFVLIQNLPACGDRSSVVLGRAGRPSERRARGHCVPHASAGASTVSR